MRAKKEYGDFQTPPRLAKRVVALVGELFGSPEVVIEPTAGLGAFLSAAVDFWKDQAEFEGYDVNPNYVRIASDSLKQFNVRVLHRDFFTEDWRYNLSQSGKARVLVIGNPPWVTNSDLGQLGSANLPKKSNDLGLRGLDARTGKSNFDIAEWMLMRLIESLPSEGALAMLCKTATARKVLRHLWKTDGGRQGTRLFRIDAKSEFNVAVDACLFFATGKRTPERFATVYSHLNTESEVTRFGFLNDDLVSDIHSYQARKNLDGGPSTYVWRSGIKHDAAKVMEFSRAGRTLINGFGEAVDIEDDFVFPLLKSSDLGNGRTAVRKSVLVTQRHTGSDTMELKHMAPKTWKYLLRHAEILDRRKSSIYADRPRFSVFGIGDYSFAPWKVAISGLYKNISFTVVSPNDERPVMVDDTCYFISCETEEEAVLLSELLTSDVATEFLRSLIFIDAKRPVTIDVLRRLSISELARDLGKHGQLQRFVSSRTKGDEYAAQLLLPM